MSNEAIDYLIFFIVFFGLIPSTLMWLWIAFCKYILHFRRGCNNRKCWYHCKKCPFLHSEQLKLRIAMLESKYPKDHGYITMLRNQLQMYLDNPDLDRETESETLKRLSKEAKERANNPSAPSQ
ncbi:MAG: hypothetical protein K2O34_10585 [Acetatifactor sp.]|nr:hypothetical protein [Acetatifactor sp.]